MFSSLFFKSSRAKNSAQALQRNLWAIFFILFFLGTGILSALVWFTWDRIYTESVNHQKYAVNLVASSTSSTLFAQENLLDLLGTHLLENDRYLDTEYCQHLFDKLMEHNHSIAAFALISLDGDILLTNKSFEPDKRFNLKHYPQTKASFTETLENQHSVVGRTYFIPKLDRWAMPIRKAIRDESGKAVAVVSVVLEISGENSFIEAQGPENSEDKSFLILVRESDLYFQYVSPNFLSILPEAYDVPISKEVSEAGLAAMTQSGINQEDIYAGLKTYTAELRDRQNVATVLSLRYLPEQKLWVIARTNKEQIFKQFLATFIWFFISFVITTLTVYLLFKKLISTEQNRVNELEFKTHHDHLTKLPNLAKLEALIKSETLFFADKYSVFYIDLDNFKFVNETYGRSFGDQVLIDIAKRLQHLCPDPNCVIHVSSDKFIVIKPTVEESAHQAVEVLRQTLITPYTKHDANIILTASIGIANYPEHGEDIEDLVKLAETIMFEAKKHKNQYMVFDTSTYHSYQQRLNIEHQLKTAISSDELYMLYQPQVDTQGKIIGVEALARWNNASLGHVPPDQFILVAETSGLMSSLGQHILTMIERDCVRLVEHLQHSLDVAINISATQFLQEDFVDAIKERFCVNTFEKINFVLELTESIFIEDIDYIHDKVDELHLSGFDISLDDFGTGFSSLSLLRDVPFDELKIDKSFIDTIADDKTAQKMVKNIISTGQILEMSVIAEGVESRQQLSVLELMDCHRFQGYYFFKPISMDDLINNINQQKQ